MVVQAKLSQNTKAHLMTSKDAKDTKMTSGAPQASSFDSLSQIHKPNPHQTDALPESSLDHPKPKPDSETPHTVDAEEPTHHEVLEPSHELAGAFEPIRLKIGTLILLTSLLVIPALLLFRGANPFDIAPFQAIQWGANLTPLVLAGETWRLISSIFMHFGAAHLALNFLGLALFGHELEKRSGAIGLIAVFLVAGVAGSAAHVAWELYGPSQVTLAAGASGGILGLNGLLLMLNAARPDPRALFNTRALLWLAAINLGYGFVMPGIDNAAHIGGFAAGVLLGGVYLLGRYSIKR